MKLCQYLRAVPSPRPGAGGGCQTKQHTYVKPTKTALNKTTNNYGITKRYKKEREEDVTEAEKEMKEAEEARSKELKTNTYIYIYR